MDTGRSDYLLGGLCGKLDMNCMFGALLLKLSSVIYNQRSVIHK